MLKDLKFYIAMTHSSFSKLIYIHSHSSVKRTVISTYYVIMLLHYMKTVYAFLFSKTGGIKYLNKKIWLQDEISKKRTG